MDRQVEYLIARNQVPRGQITNRLFILFIFLVIAYVAIWYFWPTSDLANIPYCVGNIFSTNSSVGDHSNTLTGVYVSPREGPLIDNFSSPFAHFLRFNDNGKVMYTMDIFNYRFNWRATSARFNWLYFDSTVFIGNYKIDNNRIQFTSTRPSDNLYIEWTGVIEDGNLRFDSTFYFSDEPLAETLVFKPYNVEQCPFGNE